MEKIEKIFFDLMPSSFGDLSLYPYYIYIIVLIYLIVGFIYIFFMKYFNNKLNLFEKKVLTLFEKRTNLVPALYEITDGYIEKHSEVFKDIIALRKEEFLNGNEYYLKKLYLEKKIHHELNLIFKICNKNKKLEKFDRYLHMQDLFLENSEEIGYNIEVFKKYVSRFNFFLNFKYLFIIPIFTSLEKRDSI